MSHMGLTYTLQKLEANKCVLHTHKDTQPSVGVTALGSPSNMQRSVATGQPIMKYHTFGLAASGIFTSFDILQETRAGRNLRKP